MTGWVRNLLHKTPTALGVVASLIAIGGLAIGAYGALRSGDSRPTFPEHRQIVAFHQISNRICTENAQAMKRAFPAAHSYSELLVYLSRAIRWGIRDLTSIVPPPRFSTAFGEEIENRQTVAGELLDLQRAHEIGNETGQARVKLEIAGAESRAAELSRDLGLARCAPILPARWLSSAA